MERFRLPLGIGRASVHSVSRHLFEVWEGSDTDPTPGSTSSLGDTRISKANRGPYRPAPFNGTRTTTASSLWTISLENE